jgi:hypothetical protein
VFNTFVDEHEACCLRASTAAFIHVCFKRSVRFTALVTSVEAWPATKHKSIEDAWKQAHDLAATPRDDCCVWLEIRWFSG